jgi:site-specific DNA-adenine methylase
MIGQYLPEDIQTFYEPFCGSGAMTIYAAYYRLADDRTEVCLFAGRRQATLGRTQQ